MTKTASRLLAAALVLGATAGTTVAVTAPAVAGDKVVVKKVGGFTIKKFKGHGKKTVKIVKFGKHGGKKKIFIK